MAAPENFQFCAKKVFLTFPQCDHPKELILEYFQENFPIDKYCIAEELHEDGNKHIHALFTFDTRQSTRNCRFFDIKIEDTTFWHGNIAFVPNKADLTRRLTYCQKDGNFITNFDPIKRSWGDIIENSQNAEEFTGDIIRNYPRDGVIFYDRIDAFANRKWNNAPTPYQTNPTYAFTPPMECTTWYEENIVAKPNRPLTLLLIGATRIGKTEWARSLGRHMYFNGMFNLEDYDETVDYIIFDDFDWEYFGSKKQWWGAQREFTVTDKYRKKKTIKWGKPMIYLCNPEEDPFINTKMTSHDWFRQNCKKVVIPLGLRFY